MTAVGDLITYRNGRYRVLSVADDDGKLDPPLVTEGGGLHLAYTIPHLNGEMLLENTYAQPGAVEDMVQFGGDDRVRPFGLVEFADWEPLLPQVASLLNRFPEVRWDRCTEAEGGIEAFGWIDRDDGKHDFLALDIRLPTLAAGFVTSSAALSRAFAVRLWGAEGAENHNDCKRVEDRFGDLVSNKVALAGTDGQDA